MRDRKISDYMTSGTLSRVIRPCPASLVAVCNLCLDTNPRMTMRYSHLSEEYLRAAVNSAQLGRSGRLLRPWAEEGSYLALQAKIRNAILFK